MCSTLLISTNTRRYIVLNPEEYDNQYMQLCFVSPNEYSSGYLVFAENDSDALDELADYGQRLKYTGWFVDEEDIDNDNDIVRVGNHGWPMDAHRITIRSVAASIRKQITLAMAGK